MTFKKKKKKRPLQFVLCHNQVCYIRSGIIIMYLIPWLGVILSPTWSLQLLGYCTYCRSQLLTPCPQPQSQHRLHTIPLSNAPHLSVLAPNFQLWECCYWDNDLFLVGSPPPPSKKKSWEYRAVGELAGNKQFCVFPSRPQFWLELSFNKRCVEGERAQVGLNQSLIWSEHQRSNDCGSAPGIRGELLPGTRQQAGRAPREPRPHGRERPFPLALSSDARIWWFEKWQHLSLPPL